MRELRILLLNIIESPLNISNFILERSFGTFQVYTLFGLNKSLIYQNTSYVLKFLIFNTVQKASLQIGKPCAILIVC